MIRRYLSLIAGIAFALTTFQTHASVADPIRNIGASLSNYLALIQGEGTPDRKVVAALNKSIKAASKASDTDMGVNIKLAGQIATAILRSSVSNEFGDSIESVVDDYTLAVASAADSSSNLLRSAYTSRTRTAAERNLVKLYEFLASSEAAADSILAAKSLSKAATKAKVVDKLVAKALTAPPPPAHVTATVEVSGMGRIAFKSDGGGITQFSPGNFTIITGGVAGTELRTVDFALNGLVPGDNNVAINFGIFTYTSLKRNGTFVNGQGSAQINWNPDTKTLSGTFNYNMTEQGGSRTASLTGTLFGTYP